ncbi:MAG: TrmH family RNA methyltransferase [Spirosomataceae bacterium]|jgi:TrmH family RNA methyltransferase
MLTNAQQKYVLSLHQKKYRKLNSTFIVEGRKNVGELLASDYQVQQLFATEIFLESNPLIRKDADCTIINEKELGKISTLKTSDQVLAVVNQFANNCFEAVNDELVLVLDGVKDPGNLGTIIRIADWYGIDKVICSLNTVEFYNPKVIMATMGSFSRVKVFVTDLEEYFNPMKSVNVYGAYLEGSSVYEQDKAAKGYLVMGSESHGISSELESYITEKVTIPRRGKAESLNVAISTAILLDNFLKFK